MDSDDGESIRTTSTDTSMFLRELQALNTSVEGTPTGPIATGQSYASDGMEVTGSGDAGDSQTLPQAMKTIVGPRPKQTIDLEEKQDEDSASVYSPEVEIYVSPINDSFVSSGSNKVKIVPVVNHQWELKYYPGNLVAVHKDTEFMAYVLRGANIGNVVRVLSRKTAERALLKSFKGQVMDLAFALSDDVYLAVVDERGSLYVYSFTSASQGIEQNLVLHIDRATDNISDYFHMTRVIWCPYIPEEEADEDSVDPAKMLVLLHGTIAEVWNVDVAARDQVPGPISVDSVTSGLMAVDAGQPDVPVVNAAFAPDGSAIALAYYSGIVKFFLVDLETSKTDCMYDWNPHNGCPLSSLFFLDDHKHQEADLQLWKFALTGAKHNTEIKLWSCETWACVQTLNFLSPIKQPDLKLEFKSDIDLSSKYLALSDINSKVLYVLQIHQNYSSSTAHVSSIAQFSLTQPCLSFAIFDAGVKKFKHSANDSHLDEITTGELEKQVHEEDVQNGDSGVTSGVQLKMYGVHVKSLQELLIRYRPEASVPDFTSASSLSQDDTRLRDMLSDVSIDQSEASQDMSSAQPAYKNSSPSVKAHDETSRVSLSSTSSFTEVTAMNEDLIIMDSPRSSVAPSSVLSPSSAFTKTPSQVDNSPGIPTSALSLSNLPLPPIASSGESGTAAEENNSHDQNGQKTPPSSPVEQRALQHEDTAVIAISPASQMVGDLSSQPVVDQSSSSFASSAATKSGQDILAEMFQAAKSAAAAASREGLGDSMESASSTGSFPVQSLIKSFKDEKYDDDDKEVAEALGVEVKEEEPEKPAAEEDERYDEEDNDGAEWPEPPDVSTEAKRLVDQALEQGVEEEDGEKELDDDENDDEGEVEEIIQQSLDGTDVDLDVGDEDIDDEAEDMIDYPERPRNPEPGQTHQTKALQNIDEKVSSLVEQLQQHQQMMQRMQEELTHQRDLQTQLRRHQLEQQQLQQAVEAQQSSTSTLEQDVSRLEDVLASRMERSLAQHMQRETKKFEDALHKSEAQRKQRDDTMQKMVIHEVSHSVKHTLAETLRTEIKQTVNPALHRFVEPMKDKIHQEVAHRLTACDTLLKDNIAKAVKSRSTMDMLATSVGDVMYQHMQQAYTDSFRTAMLPAYKDALEKSVRDVHSIFQQGTKEYQLYMRQTVDQMLKERIATDELVTRMEAAEKQFAQSVIHMKALLISSVKEELSGQVAHAVASVKSDIVSDVRRLMKEEMGQALQEHGASISDQLNTYLRSGAGTPVPHSTFEEESNKEKILRDLKAGRVNEAFQIALSVGNIDLVVFACESAKPLDIFSQSPFPLTQPILLSLISQLSANLDKNFDLKLKYLEEAVMFLDPTQPTTSEHIPNVVGGLVSSLQNCDLHGGDSRKVKSVRMLIMAGKSLLS